MRSVIVTATVALSAGCAHFMGPTAEEVIALPPLERRGPYQRLSSKELARFKVLEREGMAKRQAEVKEERAQKERERRAAEQERLEVSYSNN